MAQPTDAAQQQAQLDAYIQQQVSAQTQALAAQVTALQNQLAGLIAAQHVPAAPAVVVTRSRRVVPPEKYKGERGNKVLLHLTALQDYFVSLNLNSDDEKLLAAIELHADAALVWWHNLSQLNQRPATYADYEVALKRQFEGANSVQVAFTELERLNQTGTVEAYVLQFESLSVQAEYDSRNPAINHHLKLKFQQGLRRKIRAEVMSKSPASYEAARDLALTQEAIYNTWRSFEEGYSKSSASSRSQGGSSSNTPMELGAAEVKHDKYPKGLGGKQPPFPRADISKEEEQRRRANGLCIYCAAKGHITRECPKRQEDAKKLQKS